MMAYFRRGSQKSLLFSAAAAVMLLVAASLLHHRSGVLLALGECAPSRAAVGPLSTCWVSPVQPVVGLAWLVPPCCNWHLPAAKLGSSHVARSADSALRLSSPGWARQLAVVLGAASRLTPAPGCTWAHSAAMHSAPNPAWRPACRHQPGAGGRDGPARQPQRQGLPRRRRGAGLRPHDHLLCQGPGLSSWPLTHVAVPGT